jgi:hypothetical protein
MLFKMMITGRRRPGQTFAEMSRHMIEVHGPKVTGNPHITSTYLRRYIQNHVVDAGYGAQVPYGRDHVAELVLAGPDAPGRMGQEPYVLEVIRPDELNFVHPSDRFFMPVEEEVVIEPPKPALRGAKATAFKAMHYLKRNGGASGEPFFQAWIEEDRTIIAGDPLRSMLRGYVRNRPLPPQGGEPPYDGVASLWFDPADGPNGFALWRHAIEASGLIDPDRSFFLFAEEHQMLP